MADETLRFIKFGKQTVQSANIIRAEWEIAQSGRSVMLLLHISDGHIMSIPYEDPICKRAADLLGFTDEYAAWPKQKVAAEAKFKAEQDQKEAEKKRQFQLRQRGYGG